MGNVNKVILVGNLGADPELKRTTTTQRPYCHLSVATDHVFKDKTGQRQTQTDWHRVTVWGELAEQCTQRLTKGRSVYIEGYLQTRSWEDEQKKRHRATDIVASRIEFLEESTRQAA